jgi:hypothetical protein
LKDETAALLVCAGHKSPVVGEELCMVLNFKGAMSESYSCVDCGFDTASGNLNRLEAEQAAAAQIARGIKNWALPFKLSDRQETYIVHNHVWKAAGMEPWGGCLCIGCLEKRIGRKLMPMDFPADHPLNSLPGTPRLMERQGIQYELGDFPEGELAAVQ